MLLFLEEIYILLTLNLDLKIPRMIEDVIFPVPINPKIMNNAE